MSLKASILLRTRLVFVLGMLLALGISTKIVYLQYATKDKWKQLPDTPMQRHVILQADRGSVYASDGSLLATSLPYYKIAIDPTLPSDYLLKQNLDSLCWLLADFFGENKAAYYKEKILRARVEKKRYLPLITREISHATRKRIMHWPLLREGRLTGGVILDKVSRRFRPFGNLAVRTIGYMNRRQRGIVGLEYSFDRVLGGEDGRVLIERSLGGRWRPLYDGSEIHPRHGEDIYTTLDVNIQEVAQSSLLQAMYKHQADYGTAVVMEVETGEIKAIANLSRSAKGRFVSNYNYAVAGQGVVEPGSTFKLATILALLEHGNLQLSDSVQTGGGTFSVYNSVMRDDKRGGWGMLSVEEAFLYSSNIGIARLAIRHFGAQPELYTRYLSERLHLSEPLGFQLKGEGRPYLKTPMDSSWSGTSLAWMAHGYEIALSPLQLLTLYNAVANDGRMVAPLLVRSIRKDERIVEKFKSRVIEKKIASQENIEQLQTLLEEVVLLGTAKNIRSNYYRMAGKTGTAKKYKEGRYVDQYYASFVGYFPADAPQYSCIVAIDNPRQGGTYGAEVAGPVFRKIADRVCRRGLRVSSLRPATDMPRIGGGWSSDIKLLCDELGIDYLPLQRPAWVRTINAGMRVAFRRIAATDRVPDLRGMTLRDALYLAENAGLRPLRRRSGTRVLYQYPPPGGKLLRGSDITLTMK